MAPGVFNYSGAGKAIRENAKNGRLLELVAIRNGLNTSHLYHNTAALSNILEPLLGNIGWSIEVRCNANFRLKLLETPVEKDGKMA